VVVWCVVGVVGREVWRGGVGRGVVVSGWGGGGEIVRLTRI